MAKLGTDNEYSTALYPNRNAPPTVNTKFSTEIKCLLIDWTEENKNFIHMSLQG